MLVKFLTATFIVAYENLNFSPERFIVRRNSFANMISRSRNKLIL